MSSIFDGHVRAFEMPQDKKVTAHKSCRTAQRPSVEDLKRSDAILTNVLTFALLVGMVAGLPYLIIGIQVVGAL